MRVFGVSFDSQEENRAFAEKLSFPFQLLCDTERSLGLAYGACTAKDEAHARRLTYVIGPDGRVEKAVDTKDPGAQAAELLDDL